MRYVIGFFATLGFLAVLLFSAGLFGVFWFADKHAEAPELPEKMVLKVRLTGPLADVSDASPLGNLIPARRGLSLFDLVTSIDAARTDGRVTGLVMDLSGADLGLAEAQELRASILGFRAAGKSARVFADSFEGRGASAAYFLASAFERVTLQPSGLLDIRGLSITTPLLGRLLDEYGVRAEILTRHEFKGAAVPVTSKSLPGPIRANHARAVESMFEQLVAGISTGRDLTPSAVRTLIDTAPLVAREARSNNLVDELAYWDQMSAISGSGANVVNLADYAHAIAAEALEAEDDNDEDRALIALISAEGEIVRGRGQSFGNRDQAASDRLISAIREARKEPAVKAVVLRVNSPGGSYVASDSILRALEQTRATGIPIVVSMGNVAASGGYFITLAADHVVARPATITGSIGVLGGKISVGELLSRHGVDSAEVRAGANATMFSPLKPFADGERERLSKILDEIYGDFTARVAKRRRLSATDIDAAARGRIWTGEDALRQGLVDVLGGFEDAISLARQSAGLEPGRKATPTVFPRRGSPLEQLLDTIEEGDLQSLASDLGDLIRVLRYASRVEQALPKVGHSDGILLRMPDLDIR